LISLILRREAVGDLAFGARPRASVVAGAANEAALRLIVTLDHRGSGEAGEDRAELHCHLSLGGVCVVLGQLNAGQTRRDQGNVGEHLPYLCRRLHDHEALLEPRPAFACFFGCGLWRCLSWSGLACRHEDRQGRCRRRYGRGSGHWRLRCMRLDHASNRIDDAEIAGAAAQIAGKLDPDSALVRVRQPAHDVARRDQHAGRAEAAL
jgi:hypothetical protein